MRLSRTHLLSSALWTLVAAATATSADIVEDRRLLRCYDFEEKINGRHVGEFERLPIDWYAIGRTAGVGDVNFTRVPIHKQLVETPGYASWTEVRYDDRHSSSGRFSLYLGLDGGSAGAFLRVGVLPAIPASDYVISAAIRTTPLHHASARITASFVDSAGRRIEDSVVTSKPLRTDGKWQRPVLWLPGDQPNAAWISLQIELNQDARNAAPPRPEHRIDYEQVRGGSWFDDICVWQVPRVAVTTQSRVNIVRAPDRPRLTTFVRDLSGQQLTARLRVHDDAGTLVAQTRQRIGGGLPPLEPWAPALPRFGWYVFELTVVDQDPAKDKAAESIAGSALGAVLWLPDEPTADRTDLKSFTLLAEAVDREQLSLVPDLIEASRVKSVSLSAWEAGTTPANLAARQSMLDAILERLWSLDAAAALSLHPVPDDVRRQLDVQEGDGLGLLAGSKQQWEPLLNPMLMRYGHRVRRWRLGSMGSGVDTDTAARPQACRDAREHIGRLLPSPRLDLPWPLTRSPDRELDGVVQLVLDVPESVQADQIGSYVWPWSDAAFGMHLRTPAATALTQPRRCRDLALRMLYGWESGASGLSLTRPWTHVEGSRTTLVPDPLLGVFATVSHRLAGRRAAGRLDLGPGLRCILFDGEEAASGAMLAAWNRSAPGGRASVELDLGGEPVAVDLFGNRMPLPRGPHGHRLDLSRTPVLIEGVDRRLALFRASFAVEPAFVESKQTIREHRIRLTNPWPRTINGKIQIRRPVGWTFEPRQASFTMAAGESLAMPMRVSLPVWAVAGDKTLTARVTFEADRPYSVNLSAALTLGLPQLVLDATVDVVPNPNTKQLDAVVTQVIANLGTDTLALYAFTNVAGFGRQEIMIPRLEPGTRVRRQFRFPGGGDGVRDAPVRVGLREDAGPAVLNKIIPFGGSTNDSGTTRAR